MTTYGVGLEYDAVNDELSHAPSNATPGVYTNPGIVHVDSEGHVSHIESGVIGSGYIEGLGFSYVDGDNVSVSPGAAFVPALNKIVTVAAPITVPIGSVNSQSYYLYLRESNSVGVISAETTEPAAPYFGSARTMTGDTSARYLGMVKNDIAGRVIPIDTEVLGGASLLVLYGGGYDAQTIMGIDGLALTTTRVTRSIGPGAPTAAQRMVPPSCRTIHARLERANNTSPIRVGWPADSVFNALPVYFQETFPIVPPPMRLDPSNAVQAQTTSGTNTLYLMVTSYYDRR